MHICIGTMEYLCALVLVFRQQSCVLCSYCNQLALNFVHVQCKQIF
jgi:hypothetical protein